MIDINDENWKEQLENNKIVVLKFSALWCSPCSTIAPIVEELSNQFEGKLVVSSIDVDENPKICNEFQIRNIPTILFFKNSEIIDKQVGAISKSELEKKFNNVLKD
jgi:thioredoxin 1